MSLFRKEAVSHQSERLTGAIILAQPLSIKLTVSIVAAIAIAIVAFLINAEYSRKETVRGFLMPNGGVIKSFATQGGTVDSLFVSEGDKVEKGQPLATMVVHKNSADGKSLSGKLQGELISQLALIDEEIKQYKTIQVEENRNLENKVIALNSEKLALERQLILANEKLALLLAQQEDVERLNSSGYVSKYEKENQKKSLLEAQQEKQNIARLLLQQNNQINQAVFDKANLPQQYTLRINSLLREKSAIENQLAQVQNSHRYTIAASHAGTVTGIQVVEGETLSPSKAQSKPLLHILPEGSELVAELLLPTRSAGFIAKGQISRLRFDAFPYQRFGFIESEIVRIDRALITPNEVQLPIPFQEAVYRLRAKLAQQKIQAYGQEFELKSGMLFEADIMLEQRTLIEWLLEPIYSLKGRVS
ncbi:HlyD family efflux transporter periplasmic adaptor subunit [Aestuariibacter halophilus]|uniref:HlyD family efflux transporter periplasmic adaptor subunit n=1 Tax=Fluctibacter halophilus TaxID=226011 RepID=A0ABS8GC43_9ALTE|nr:HlyD family efflux transporter periplasmic adaptor subunit [Aestuariibacter halophilus]MCC2617958.1 HlyD family efflux transporter periplasmic adaptor subunit [Aestuariibacter halophilus]